MHPRKVRGGVRLSRAGAAFPDSWAATRWIRLMEKAAAPSAASEGQQYARLGQTRQMHTETGAIKAQVQGRAPRAYDTSITLTPFSHDQWETLIGALTEQPVYGARLTSGEVTPALDEMLARRGLALLPADAADLRVRCTCEDGTRTPGLWCKHACCTAYLVAERIAGDPFVLFALRGMGRDELLERLRQRRALEGAGAAGVPVYAPHVPGVSDAPAPPLEECLEHFWDAPRAGADRAPLDLPLAPPEVSHPLLRRLGPSPFAEANGTPGARFPIVGLLATCYEAISEAVIRREEDGTTSESGDTSDGAAPGAEDPSRSDGSPVDGGGNPL